MPARPDWEVESGQLELCFHDPMPELTGSVRMRFDLTGPDGTLVTLRSPDTITALNGKGECVPSDTLCCDFAGAGNQELDAGHEEAAPAAHERSVSGCGVLRPQPEARSWWRLAITAALMLRRGRKH